MATATYADGKDENSTLLSDQGDASLLSAIGEEEVHIDNQSFNEDLYEFAACALIRDAFLLSSTGAERKPAQQHSKPLRCSRILFSVCLLWANIFVQAFLIFEAKKLISARAVNNIRNVYSEYEAFMYNNNTHLTVNGFHRGNSSDFFHPENFENDFFDDDKKLSICQISLSQPNFLMTILFIWALICIGEISNALRLFTNLVARLPTISTMSEAIILEMEGDGDEEDVDAVAGATRIVVGLTLPFKIMVTIMIIVPQLTIACFLLWLGSRWLLATNDFANVMLNAVALEFIFALKDLFYRTVLSDRNKVDVERTKIKVDETNVTTVWSMFSKALWIPLAFIWVLFYVYHLQAVLPEYRWDVHKVCEEFIAELTAV